MTIGIFKRIGTFLLLLAVVAVAILLSAAWQVDALPAEILTLIICLEIISVSCTIPLQNVSAGYRFGIPPRSPPIR